VCVLDPAGLEESKKTWLSLKFKCFFCVGGGM